MDLQFPLDIPATVALFLKWTDFFFFLELTPSKLLKQQKHSQIRSVREQVWFGPIFLS